MDHGPQLVWSGRGHCRNGNRRWGGFEALIEKYMESNRDGRAVKIYMIDREGVPKIFYNRWH